MSEDTARAIHALLVKASGAIDASVATLQAAGVSAAELSEYKHAAGRTLMSLFDELLLPLYQQHPAIIPPELDRRYLR